MNTLKDIFIKKANLKYNNKYDYIGDYINSKTNMIILCPKHGKFEQTPDRHLQTKYGCKKCYYDITSKKNNFIKNSKNKFRNKLNKPKFDYSKVDYVNSKTKVIIICSEHGEFEQTPDNHLRSKYGCKKCYTDINNNDTNNLKIYDCKKINKFIIKAKKIHNNFYYYYNDYINNKTKITILCPEHGNFEQTPHDHLKGNGCSKCSCTKLTMDIFIKRGQNIHDSKYGYAGEYINNKTKITIICPEHGEFEQTPQNHLKGYGCSKCLYKNEQKYREYFEDYFDVKFEKYRFKYCDSFHELDGYNEKLNIAFEYQGQQHYYNISYFHKNSSSLMKIQIRDEIKRRYCKKKGIILIIIPYYYKYEDKENLIFDHIL